MSPTEAGAVVVTTNGNGVTHHKKLRKKRKELDALVPEEKIRRKSSSGSHHDLLFSDSDDIEFGGRGSQRLFGNEGLFGILPGAFTLLVLVVTVVGLGATLKLLMTTRKDLDALHIRFNAVEASGSELPAKFHESHVRLQMVEKNHSAIWNSLNEMAEDMLHVKTKLSAMETSLNTLEKSLLKNPSLSSLPKNVGELQKSVATFGASLQDVQTSFKVAAEHHEKIINSLESNEKSIASIQEEFIALQNASFLPPSLWRGTVSPQPVSLAILNINDDISSLNSTISYLNSSVSSMIYASNEEYNKVFEKQFASLSQRFEEVDKSLSILPIQNLTSMPSEVTYIKETMAQFGNNLENLSNSIDVVKGVERKLEGSQVQMASEVSVLKQQIQQIEDKVSDLRMPVPNSLSLLPTEKHKRSTENAA